MKKIFGVKKEKEPPPSINDASDRVRTYQKNILLLLIFLFMVNSTSFFSFICLIIVFTRVLLTEYG